MAEQHCTHSTPNSGFCDRAELQPIDDRIPVGSPGLVVDYAACDTCGCPVPGSQFERQESDMEG